MPNKTDEELLAELANQDKFVVGYQYSPDNGKFIGKYTFPNNLDKLEIHLPPFTTLDKPPEEEGKDTFFEGGAWVLKDEVDLLDGVQVPAIPFDDLMPEFIAELKAAGVYKKFVNRLHKQGIIDTTDDAVLDAKLAEGVARRRLDADMIEAYAENNRRNKAALEAKKTPPEAP